MRTINLCMLFSFLICANAFAQPWNQTGGNASTNPATDYVGTNDLKPLVFRTNSLERMRIDAGGNVGIGTTTPNVKLHVADTNWADGIRIGDNFRLREYSGNFGSNTLEIYHDDDMGIKRIVFFANDSGATMDGYFDDGRVFI